MVVCDCYSKLYHHSGSKGSVKDVRILHRRRLGSLNCDGFPRTNMWHAPAFWKLSNTARADLSFPVVFPFRSGISTCWDQLKIPSFEFILGSLHIYYGVKQSVWAYDPLTMTMNTCVMSALSTDVIATAMLAENFDRHSTPELNLRLEGKQRLAPTGGSTGLPAHISIAISSFPPRDPSRRKNSSIRAGKTLLQVANRGI